MPRTYTTNPGSEGWRRAVTAARRRVCGRSRVILGLQLLTVLACYATITIAGGLSWFWVAALTILVPTLLLIGHVSSRHAEPGRVHCRELHHNIRDVQLTERLLSGEITGNELSSHTPWPFSLIVRPWRRATKQQVVERVATAIEWYCGPPRTFLPPAWVSTGLIVLTLGLGVVLVVLLNIPVAFVLENLWLVVLGLSFVNLSDPEQDSLAALDRELFRLWQDPPAADAEPDAAPHAGPGLLARTGQRTYNRMQAVLNLLEQHTGRVRFSFLQPASSLAVLVSAVLMFAQLPLVDPVFHYVIPVLLIGCTSSPVIIQALARYSPLAAAYRTRVRSRLADSDVPVRIVTGEIPEFLNRLGIPPLWRPLARYPLAPRGSADDFLRDIWQAGSNLDWLFEQPRRAIRTWWWLLPVQFLGILIALAGAVWSRVANNGLGCSGGELCPAVVLSLLALVLAWGGAVPAWVHEGRMIIWREELLDELGRNLRR